jgi:glycosyltransferase involved in cell wall biosynthesis
MHILFIHDAFPAQFGRLALELNKRYGWKCSFLVEDLSRCPTPTPEMLQFLEIQRLPLSDDLRKNREIPWAQVYGRYLESCRAVYDAVRTRPDWRPDLVVAHGGRGAPTLFLPEVLNCPIINYCEYYFAPSRRDISYRVDLPLVDPSQFYPRCINAMTLVSLVDCHAGYSPTQWQKETFPKRFWPKIEVHFDGIDTELYRPRSVPRVLAGKVIPADTRVVTFVARGLESMRGFDQFMKLARRISCELRDVIFVVVGGEEIYYGWDKLHTGQPSFKKWVLSQGEYDLEKFVFLDYVEPSVLADILCLSDLHVYLTVPFVLSWSFFDALACGRVVLASDVDPVLEVIEPEKNGLVAPFFDSDALCQEALQVLKNPGEFRPLGEAARTIMENRYSIGVCIPALKEYFERISSVEVSQKESIQSDPT